MKSSLRDGTSRNREMVYLGDHFIVWVRDDEEEDADDALPEFFKLVQK